MRKRITPHDQSEVFAVIECAVANGSNGLSVQLGGNFQNLVFTRITGDFYGTIFQQCVFVGSGRIELDTLIVTGYENDEDDINRLYHTTGIIILVTSNPLTVQETLEAYGKRDCVEKTFQSFKSYLGMDKIGAITEEAMHGKGLVWFAASILHALIFVHTAPLRRAYCKHYTVPVMIEELETVISLYQVSTLFSQAGIFRIYLTSYVLTLT